MPNTFDNMTGWPSAALRLLTASRRQPTIGACAFDRQGEVLALLYEGASQPDVAWCATGVNPQQRQAAATVPHSSMWLGSPVREWG